MSNDIISLANEIATSKENIRLAITTAGVDCPEDTPFANYASKISQIQNRIDNVGTDIFYRGSDSNLTSETTSYTVPSNYAVIGNGAMANSTSLQTLSMPNVTVAFDRAFTGCQNLTTINAPMCKYYGDNALMNTGISGAYTNDVAEHFGAGCFRGNKTLTSVSLPNAKELGANCFYGCNKVETISVPKVESIGDCCFVNFGDNRYDIDNVQQKWTLDVPECKKIGSSAANNNLALESFNIPKVQHVGEKSFCINDYTNAKQYTNDLSIPDCEYIGPYAFQYRNFPNIIVKNGCVIEKYAFANKDNNSSGIRCTLKTVGGKPSYIGENAFEYNNCLSQIDLSQCVHIGSYAFRLCQNLRVADLSNCKTLGESSSSSSSVYVFYKTSLCEDGTTMKIWAPSTIESIYCKLTDGNNVGILYDIYTDISNWSSRPSGWSNNTPSRAQMHYGATYEDFLNACSL